MVVLMFSITIPHKHSLSYISEMREELLNAVASHDNIVIDVSDIDYITTPLLELFLSLHKTTQDNQKTFTFKNASSYFKETISDFGCQDHLERAFQ